jgi:hypothetical protein
MWCHSFKVSPVSSLPGRWTRPWRRISSLPLSYPEPKLTHIWTLIWIITNIIIWHRIREAASADVAFGQSCYVRVHWFYNIQTSSLAKGKTILCCIAWVTILTSVDTVEKCTQSGLNMYFKFILEGYYFQQSVSDRGFHVFAVCRLHLFLPTAVHGYMYPRVLVCVQTDNRWPPHQDIHIIWIQGCNDIQTVQISVTVRVFLTLLFFYV